MTAEILSCKMRLYYLWIILTRGYVWTLNGNVSHSLISQSSRNGTRDNLSARPNKALIKPHRLLILLSSLRGCARLQMELPWPYPRTEGRRYATGVSLICAPQFPGIGSLESAYQVASAGRWRFAVRSHFAFFLHAQSTITSIAPSCVAEEHHCCSRKYKV